MDVINTPSHKQVTVEDVRTEFGVMTWGMMFSHVVGDVVFLGIPCNAEMLLERSIAKPMETHIDGTGATDFESFFADAGGGSVICLDRRW